MIAIDDRAVSERSVGDAFAESQGAIPGYASAAMG